MADTVEKVGERRDGTFEKADFVYDHKRDLYTCPGGKELRSRQITYKNERPLVDEDGMVRYRASKHDCDPCALKPKCCPNTPARKIPRSIHEGARDMARDIAKTEAYVTSRRERKKVESTPPPKAVCRDLLIGFKSMPYVMRYSHFPH